MGAWGYDFHQNDTALDLESEFARYLRKGDNLLEAFGKLKESHLMGYNEARLMYAKLRLDYDLEVDINLSRVFSEELSEEFILKWNEDYRNNRIDVLCDLAKKLGYGVGNLC